MLYRFKKFTRSVSSFRALTHCHIFKEGKHFHSSNLCKQNLVQGSEAPKKVPGLVGVAFSKNIGVLLEVTCESQSLICQNEFISFVESVTQNCRDLFEATKSNQILFEQWTLDKKELSKLPWLQKQNTTLQDIISAHVKKLGEEISLQQAILCRVPDFAYISGYAHPGGEKAIYPYTDCQTGFYAALVALATLESFNDQTRSLNEIGRRMCQHVVGSNPTILGSPADQPLKNSEEEFRMLCQDYVLDADFTVAEIVQRFKTEILGFARLEIGKVD